MGSMLSILDCGIHRDTKGTQLDFLNDIDKHRHPSEWSRTLPISSESSVASILLEADQLIPSSFQPVDIPITRQAVTKHYRRKRNNVTPTANINTMIPTINQYSSQSISDSTVYTELEPTIPVGTTYIDSK